jgi:integrase
MAGKGSTLPPRGGECMKGTIVYRRDRGVYRINWYDPDSKKTAYVYKNHRGEPLDTRRSAEKVLHAMQVDVENGVFRLDKYTRDVPVDTIPYLREWLGLIAPTLKPATLKDYHNSIENHLVPFFTQHPIQIHEIDLLVLTKLLNWIPRSGKGKQNVMYCLHRALKFLARTKRGYSMPEFPEKRDYKIVQPTIHWVPEERQKKILDAIPKMHQPIFWWLKLHYRRPGEAIALHREDFDGEMWTVHRTTSARQHTDTTKTGEVHSVPMHDGFKEFAPQVASNRAIAAVISPYYFVNPDGKLKGKPYTHALLLKLWWKACKSVGENIGLYQGTKHSSCSQFLNEKGGTLSELQEITDHARFESVKRYAKTEVSRRKQLMERKVVSIEKAKRHDSDLPG